jgi:hypothetical protein
MPSGVTLTIVNDRTTMIRASIHDVQFTPLLSVVLVVVRYVPHPSAPPSSPAWPRRPLIANFGVMWFCGFSPTTVADGADHRDGLRRRRYVATRTSFATSRTANLRSMPRCAARARSASP